MLGANFRIVPKKPPPPRLHKYQPFNTQTLTNLTRASIWFSAPVNVNDPYDCAAWVMQTDEISDADFERLKTYVQGRNAELAARTPPDELRKSFINGARKVYDERRILQREQRGIACFSATVTDITMWSHYADGHRGFCLEFDRTLPPFSRAFEVQYVDQPPVLNPIDVLVNGPTDEEENELLRAFVLTKARCWSYEQEWRLMHEEPSKSYGYGNGPLTGIYVGAEMPIAHQDMIGRMTLGSGVQLYQMKRDTRAFTLHPEPATYTLPSKK